MKLGVGPETPVGVCLERSVEMVVALLGILKAGGAYLPLDTSYPIERLAFMIEDSRLSVLVTQETLIDTLPAVAFFVCIDDASEAALISAESDQNPSFELSADNLAYIIYTSGSTGMPKGISITHRGVVRLVCNTNYIRIRPDDRIAQASNASFDAATFELWGALLHGATIIGISKDVSLSPRAFANRLRDQEVTILFLTTALFNQMVIESPVCFAGLRYLLFGGEAVEPKWVRQVLKQGAPDHFLHVYGPTESTTYATYHHFSEVHDQARTIPIGIPLANTTVYLLDKNLDVVPVGVPGELFVGGDGLARDYLKRPELTAEKFIPNPFGRAGERLYRTGDLACYLPDGSIVFIGRADYQVKVRGFRIELEEIEAVLSRYPSVEAVVVQAWEEEPGARRLVAYLVLEGEDSPTAAELRNYLSVKLPDYMIPAAFVRMESLPLTANGKVDRKALPAPDSIPMDSDAPFVAPRTLTEELIAAAWSDLLRVPRVSRHHSFFELGGHSLLATQLISRLRDLFSVELTLRTVFDSPVLADLAAAVDLARFGSETASAVPFERVERDGPLPLSFAQQRLWFLDQLEPGTALYNVPAAVRLRGQLGVEALQRTLTEVVRRHESLRTTFTVEDGEPRQVIAEPEEFRLRVIDLSEQATAVAEQVALRVVGEEAVRPFDLATGPLLRVTVVQVSEQEQVVVLVMHHIISDGWSMGLLIGEVTRLYAAYASGAAVAPEELEWQYADYAGWQRRRLSGAALEEELSYWREQLAGAPAVLELATDRPRPAVPSYRGATETVELSAELTEGLRELSRKSGVTLFMTLLGGFQTLLWRYSGQKVVSVGTPVANRTRAEAEGIIGFFVNTLVVRGELDGRLRVGELLRQVRETCLGAYGHQEVPFERVVEELQPERSLSHTPLFQVMFVLQNTPQADIKLPDLELSMLDIANKTSTFDLSFSLTETGDTLALAIEYSTDLFDAETICRMAEHYQHLLAGMAVDDAARLWELPMLRESERRLLLDWNDTRAPFSNNKCAHQLFEAVAARQPNLVAVSHADEQISYGELNARANQLAHYLMARGIGPDVLVGLMVERSIASIISLLAVLKAGGAYVPLDPNYPDERLTYMLGDSGARLLLTEKRFIESFSAGNCEVVCIDTDQEAIARESTANLERWLSPDHLAYVIYTSGSTGKPKGVMIAHRSLVNYIEAIISDWRVGPTDRLLQFAPLSFDASAEEIYVCLLSGATLVLRTAEMLETPASFLRECGKRGVTVLDLPVAYWHELTADPSMAAWEEVPDVRLMILGVEKPQPERVARWFEILGDRIRLINAYGPTETTIVATFGDLKPQERRRDGTLPEATIGRAPQNVQAFVLDRNLQLLPIGAAGELHVGGEGLARGYLNRAELTAEKFIPHPLSDTPGARLYKTGDLAKYLPDGDLEFLGRVDHQVKLRGFRIEPGEVEVVLSQHANIDESVVIVREDTPGDKRLVAYFTMKDGADLKSSDLRNYLQERLPEYMIPSFFVPLDRLPLTAASKVDRRALPAPDLSKLTDEYLAPRTPTEEILADIWRNVLGLERVGVFDNFFQLGGHSLLITQIISRVREAFHVGVSLKVFFSGAPNIAMLAQFVEEASFAQSSDEEMDELLADLDGLSDEAVTELLARERSAAQGM
jgi:amino acid adenylation domain-containing protein